LTPACAGLLQLRGSGLKLLTSTFNAKNLISGCLGLSPAISSQFTVEMCAAAKDCKKQSPKSIFWGSFKVIDVKKFKKPVTSAMICSKSVPICNRFHTIKANSGKITSFYGEYISLTLSFRGTPSPRNTKFCHEKLETLIGAARNKNFVILACTVFIMLNGVTHGQTNGRTNRRPGHG